MTDTYLGWKVFVSYHANDLKKSLVKVGSAQLEDELERSEVAFLLCDISTSTVRPTTMVSQLCF